MFAVRGVPDAQQSERGMEAGLFEVRIIAQKRRDVVRVYVDRREAEQSAHENR